MAATQRNTAEPIGRPPFFIVGSDRSGTTLLRLYLTATSQLAIPSESWFLIDLLATFAPDAVLGAAEVDRAIAIVVEHPRFTDGWHVDPDVLRARLAGADTLTPSRFIDMLFRLETGIGDEIRWGDKTPEYVLHMATLAATFPDAQFVHIVRDGRDVFLSLASKRWSDRGHTPYELGRYWSRAVSAAREARERLDPQRYLEVTYEDLVLDTRATLERVTDFLGVGFEESMLEAHGEASKLVTAGERSAGVHDKLSREPRRSDVARWRETARSLGVILASGMMARQLREYRYPDAPTVPMALITRNVAAYQHVWLRYAAPRLRRLRAKLRTRAPGT